MRDRLDGLWCDEDFADWYPRDGRPGLPPAQLATFCVLQFLLGLVVLHDDLAQGLDARARRAAVCGARTSPVLAGTEDANVPFEIVRSPVRAHHRPVRALT
ncbi:hypothetical protein [Streptomyces anulatus]|uniref:hypothetical protein n=1 Tax=Streptomyces anulatus TaxID=1892 RepID=UPI002150E464|nr:hypothetical protein [Streptomyces anulatus]